MTAREDTGDSDISEEPFMPEYGDTKTCTDRSCTGTTEFRVRRWPEGTATTDSPTRRRASHYETWVCNKCGQEERDREPGREQRQG
jgi:hypothetical protein